MEEDGETSSPFWMQSSSRRHRSSFSYVFFSSGFLILVLLLVALLVMVFVIPPIVSFTSEIIKPNLVKKSWDNVNLVLVLFAILCGILGRMNVNDEEDENIRNVVMRAPDEEQLPQQPSQQQDQWFVSQQLEYDRRTTSEDLRWSSHLVDSNTRMIGRTMRSSSSYPDLRQESLWSSYPNDNWRFSSDDNDLYRFRSSSPPPSGHRRSRSVHDDYDGSQGSGIVKTIPVDTFVTSTNQPEPSSSPTPKPTQSAPLPPTPKPTQSAPLPPTPKPKPKPIQSAPVPPPPPSPPPLQKDIKPRVKKMSRPRENVQVEDEDVGLEKAMQESLVTPPPPLTLRTSRSVEHKSGSDHRRRSSGGGAKDIATTLASFYNQRKRKKKQRQQKSKENYDDILQSLSHNSGGASTAPPPPPPPPPPASVFQQLFKKGNKSKRIHSSSPIISPPPPPPPPPPHASTSSKRVTTYMKTSSVPSPPPPPSPPPAPIVEKRKPLTPRRPPLPTKNTSFNDDGDEINLNSGWQSPLIPMPPPPPPPPFKMPEFKFVVRGDFIRLRSTQSSRSTSPDLDSNDSPLTPSSPQLDHQGGEAAAGTSAFCPSPDVNTKADTFIARFRAGLTLEKNNSIKLKQDIASRPRSSLRPSTGKKPI